jgi:hypothetical protein
MFITASLEIRAQLPEAPVNGLIPPLDQSIGVQAPHSTRCEVQT